jgi:nucleoside-diphosphate-sugar epimerase
MDKKIALLGCGWLGFPLALKLKSVGYTVLGTTTSQSKVELFERNSILPVVCAVGDSENGIQPLIDFQPSVLFITYPLGARRMQENEHLFHVEWIKSHLNLNSLQQVVLTSSTSVYPDGFGVMDETNTIRPEGKGLMQLEFEEGLKEIFGDKLVILRLAGLIGEGRHPGKFLAGRKGLSNGDAPVNLVQLSDVLDFCEIVVSRNVLNTVYNVCNDEHPAKEVYYFNKALESNLEPPQFEKTFLNGNYKIISNKKGKKELFFFYKGLI